MTTFAPAQSVRPRSGKPTVRVRTPLLGLLPLAALLIVWQSLGRQSSPYFPRPSSWVDAIWHLARNGTLLPAVQDTLLTVLALWAIAVLLGVALGLALGLSAKTVRALQPTLEFIRMVPPPAIIPAAVLLLGADSSTTVVVVAVSAAWPILLNTTAGTEQISPVLTDVCQSLRLSRIATIRKMLFPAVLPNILVGVRVAAPIAVVVALVVEMITNLGGLGSLLISAQRSFDAAQAYGLLCIVGLLGLTINALTVLIDRRLMTKRGVIR